jgi:signal transduction histidine kinase
MSTRRAITSTDDATARFVTAVTFLAVVAAVLVIACADVRSARAVRGLGSTKTYAADGRFVSERKGEPLPRGLASRLALALQPPEISCSPIEGGGTLCVESSPLLLAGRITLWERSLAITVLLAALTALAAGWLVRRVVGRRLEAMSAVLQRAVREHDYSQRVAGTSALATSLNTFLEQMQERDVVLRRRTTDLEAANRELESFAYAVSHDLRAPLGSIDGFAQALADGLLGAADESTRESLRWIREGCRQMQELIDGLLQMSQLTRAEMQAGEVDLSAIARSVAGSLQQRSPGRRVTFRIREGVRTTGDARLLRAVVENLMGNAWKFTRDRDDAQIEFGMKDNAGATAYFVRDNGAGFDPACAAKMFRPFQRLHSQREFEGSGIGLATVQKIVARHGGRAWAEGDVGKGATVFFTTAVATAFNESAQLPAGKG